MYTAVGCCSLSMYVMLFLTMVMTLSCTVYNLPPILSYDGLPVLSYKNNEYDNGNIMIMMVYDNGNIMIMMVYDNDGI